MPSLDELISKARELKKKGMSTYEIADELKVQPDTVVWLLLHSKERPKKPAPYDLYVDWNPIGSNVRRLTFVGRAMADLIRESVASGEFPEPDVVAGIEAGGMVLGMVVAEELGKGLASVRPQRSGEKKLAGAVNPSFYPVQNRKVLLVDTVIRMGETVKAAVETLHSVRAKPVAVAVLVNKSGKEVIDGLPLKALFQLIPVVSR